LITLAIGAGLIFLILRGTGQVAGPLPTATATLTPTLEQTLAPTTTPTPQPTFTPLPPKEHTVQSGENCGLIALTYGVSVQSIVDINNLPPNCGVLTIGQVIKVPQPTPTPSPMPTTTLSIAQKTETACQKLEVRVGENDTLSGIAANYAIAIDTLKTYNGLTSDNIYVGQIIKIPLCQRLPTPGPTPTPTLPPPYSPTNLLLPADGSTFNATNETVTLQWAAIGGMREGETYAVNWWTTRQIQNILFRPPSAQQIPLFTSSAGTFSQFGSQEQPRTANKSGYPPVRPVHPVSSDGLELAELQPPVNK
jgi:LysM repeat protein